jgi:ABC-2 type transport system ATP-binding protein
MDYPLEISDLHKSFYISSYTHGNLAQRVKRYLGISKEKLVVLDSLSLKVRRGEVYGLLGQNGAGKTTLLRVLSTSVLPDRGTVRVNGLDITDGRNKDKVCSSIGLILGDRSRSFYWRLTARQNLDFFASLYDLEEKEKRERIDYLLDFVGLGKRKDEFLMRFSTGMLNRLAIARAFLHSPDILLLDEFMVNLDPKASSEIREVIRNLARAESKTVLFTSNNAYEAEAMADRVGILHNGKIRVEGPPDEIKRKYADKSSVVKITVEETGNSDSLLAQFKKTDALSDIRMERGPTFLISSRAPAPVIESCLHLAQKNNVRIRNIEIRPPSLENAFINLTKSDFNAE